MNLGWFFHDFDLDILSFLWKWECNKKWQTFQLNLEKRLQKLLAPEIYTQVSLNSLL